MNVEVISRKVIKPSPLTPHLRTFGLSLLDQLMPPRYPALVFFYLSDANNGGDIIPKFLERSRGLQKSLSETLVRFYPMAGRFKDAASIDCNDEGAYFVEARISCQLIHFLSQPDLELVNHFIPTNDTQTIEFSLDCILLVQLTVFDCGGMAIAVCASHKICDASSMFTFIQSWATTTREPGEEVMCPKFIGGSLLPPRKSLTMPPITIPSGKCATRRFVFDASKIANLKGKVGGEIGLRRPTSVEIVAALILRCAIAASFSKSGSLRPSLLFQAVNLRTRMVPPLPENTIGNLVFGFTVLVKEDEMELHELVAKMRKGLTDFCNEKVNKFKGDEGFQLVSETIKESTEIFKNTMNINCYHCTSLCKFPSYGIDFGWGNPIWTTILLNVKNSIILVDTKKGDGIEAFVTLEEEEMAIFEHNEELLAFASFNPSAFINHCRL